MSKNPYGRGKPKQFDYVVLYTVFQDIQKPVCVKDVMKRYNWSHAKAFRTMERLRRAGHVKRRSETFWNGMYYARRFWYW